ncbi:MAG: PIN domain-containing protein [Candidatus Bipolaricaulota bacterium]
MAEQPVLLVSSVWICYLRPDGWEEVKESVQEALNQGRVHTCWLVKAEILVGAKGEKSYATLREHLCALPDAPASPKNWEGAARLGYELRRKGLVVPLPDLLVAQTAKEGKLVLWHVDERFEQIALHTPLCRRSFLT